MNLTRLPDMSSRLVKSKKSCITIDVKGALFGYHTMTSRRGRRVCVHGTIQYTDEPN